MELRKQIPTPPNEWLHDGGEGYNRIFTDCVYLGKEAEPWEECTTEYKEEWAREHPMPEYGDND